MIRVENKIIENIGEIISESVLGNNSVVKTKNGLFLVHKRSVFSDSEAIRQIAQFKIPTDIYVGTTQYAEPFMDLQNVDLSLEELALLLKKIHSIKHKGENLVHGDYSSENTTKIDGVSIPFDYEHSHWGNSFLDIGRIVLRSCETFEDVEKFFYSYSNNMPSEDQLRNGLGEFCKWQNMIRIEKKREYEQVPLIRYERMQSAKRSLKFIFHAFTDPVIF